MRFCSRQLSAFLLSKVTISHLPSQTFNSFLSHPASELIGTLLNPILQLILCVSAVSLLKKRSVETTNTIGTLPDATFKAAQSPWYDASLPM